MKIGPLSKIGAICDPNLEILQIRGDAWDIPLNHRFQSLDELLAPSDIDMADVLVPHNLHHAVAMLVIKSGKRLSLQKPMTVNLTEADDLVTAAHAPGIMFKVFENLIFFPPIVLAKQLVDEGEIADLLGIQLKTNSGISLTAWQVSPTTTAWRLDPEKCRGGPLVCDDGHHKFSVAWYFFGKFN